MNNFVFSFGESVKELFDPSVSTEEPRTIQVRV